MDQQRTTLQDFVDSPAIQPHADLVDIQEIDRLPQARPIQLNPGQVSYAIEAYKIIPVALWGGIWLAGSLGARHIGIHAHNRRAWRIRLAKACATLGTITFCEMGTEAIYKEYKQDPSLEVISRLSDELRQIGHNYPATRAKLLDVGSLPLALKLYDPVQIRKAQMKADAPLISRIFLHTSWISHHFWSTRTSRAGVRMWLQMSQPDMQKTLELSPHDLDVCVTHLANSLDAGKWDLFGMYSLLTYMGTYIFDVQRHTWLSWLRRGSFWGFMVTLYLRPYQQAAYLKTIRNKGGVAAIIKRGVYKGES